MAEDQFLVDFETTFDAKGERMTPTGDVKIIIGVNKESALASGDDFPMIFDVADVGFGFG